MIWRADGLFEVLAALAPRWRSRNPSRAWQRRAARNPCNYTCKQDKPRTAVLLPGLVLNDASGRPTAEAERVARHAETLALAEV